MRIGVIGPIWENIPPMVEKIKEIGRIDRIACRRNVEEHFTVEKMVEGYEKAYNIILSL